MHQLLLPHNPVLHKFDLQRPYRVFQLALLNRDMEVSIGTSPSKKITPGHHFLTLLGFDGDNRLFFGCGGEVKKHDKKPELWYRGGFLLRMDHDTGQWTKRLLHYLWEQTRDRTGGVHIHCPDKTAALMSLGLWRCTDCDTLFNHPVSSIRSVTPGTVKEDLCYRCEVGTLVQEIK